MTQSELDVFFSVGGRLIGGFPTCARDPKLSSLGKLVETYER